MKKPEEQKPKDLTDEVVEELTEEETDEVVGGVISMDPTFKTVSPIAGGCGSKCTIHQGGKADWAAVS